MSLIVASTEQFVVIHARLATRRNLKRLAADLEKPMYAILDEAILLLADHMKKEDADVNGQRV